MVMLVEPSLAHSGLPKTVMSATICPEMLNSASSKPPHMRFTTCSESGPGTRRRRWWRSPAKVSECQSVDDISVSKILSRGTPARAINARSKLPAAADMGSLFIAPCLPDRREPARLWLVWGPAHCASRKRSVGRRRRPCRIGLELLRSGADISRLLSTNAQFNPYSTQRLGELFIPNAFPTCLGRYLSFMRH